MGGEGGKAKREAMVMSRPIRHPFFHNVTAKVNGEDGRYGTVGYVANSDGVGNAVLQYA